MTDVIGANICYVLMPFGSKANPFPGPKEIDFDLIYRNLIGPAIERAGLQPFKADQEMISGLIHRTMFERLLLCKYAVADLTTANPNVYYELGIRHAVRPWSTVLLYGSTARLPFDVAFLKAQSYAIDEQGCLTNVDEAIQRLTAQLNSIKASVNQGTGNTPISQDSPVFTLLDEHGYKGPDLTRLRLEMGQALRSCWDFRNLINKAEPGLAGVGTLKGIEAQILESADNDNALLDLLTAYRSRGAWDEMVLLIDAMPDTLRNTASVQEQYAMALGRKKDFSGAERVLTDLIDKRGPSALTYSFLGVVLKKRFLTAREDGDEVEAAGALSKALDAFLAGFKLEPRAIFTGINAALLLAVSNYQDKRPNLEELLPVVRYFINDAVSSPRSGFWEHSAELELAVLDDDEPRASRALSLMLVDDHETWMPFSTYTNLQIVQEARTRRGVAKPWYARLVSTLQRELNSVRPGPEASTANSL